VLGGWTSAPVIGRSTRLLGQVGRPCDGAPDVCISYPLCIRPRRLAMGTFGLKGVLSGQGV